MAKMGRPPSENPKNMRLNIRTDKNLMDDLDFCCKALKKTRSDIIRDGVRLVKAEIEKSKDSSI